MEIGKELLFWISTFLCENKQQKVRLKNDKSVKKP